jgi:hypothetical protein
MELILIIILLIILFGGFGYYRGGYHTRGGPYGIGGILGVVLIVVLIAWLLRGAGYVGGF